MEKNEKEQDGMQEQDTTVQAEVTQIESESLETQLTQMKDRWVRSAAELENLRRRAEREKDDALKFGPTRLARDLLEVNDNFMRALASCPVRQDWPEDVKNLIQGVGMIAKELEKVFEKHSVIKVKAKGEPFDPHVHQAIIEVETDDHNPGTVVDVMQEGYFLHDRLLRPAMVSVAKPKTEKEA